MEVYCKHITEKKHDFPEFRDQQKGVFKAHLVWGSHPSYKSMPVSEGLSTVISTFCFITTSMKILMGHDSHPQVHSGTGVTLSLLAGTLYLSPSFEIKPPEFNEVVLLKCDIISNKLLATKLQKDDDQCASHHCHTVILATV